MSRDSVTPSTVSAVRRSGRPSDSHACRGITRVERRIASPGSSTCATVGVQPSCAESSSFPDVALAGLVGQRRSRVLTAFHVLSEANLRCWIACTSCGDLLLRCALLLAIRQIRSQRVLRVGSVARYVDGGTTAPSYRRLAGKGSRLARQATLCWQEAAPSGVDLDDSAVLTGSARHPRTRSGGWPRSRCRPSAAVI